MTKCIAGFIIGLAKGLVAGVGVGVVSKSTLTAITFTTKSWKYSGSLVHLALALIILVAGLSLIAYAVYRYTPLFQWLLKNFLAESDCQKVGNAIGTIVGLSGMLYILFIL